jgi:hypothetical protein
MGAAPGFQGSNAQRPTPARGNAPIQPKVGFEYELVAIETQTNTSPTLRRRSWRPHKKGDVIVNKTGYQITADINETGSQIEFILKEIDETDWSQRRAIIDAAKNIVKDLRALMSQEEGEWVRGDSIQGIGASMRHRFRRTGTWARLTGQLQMTGGVHISKLASVMSGSALGQRDPSLPRTQETIHNYMGNYNERNNQPLWHAASNAIIRHFGGFFSGWYTSQRDILASVITMMAQIPLNARGAGMEGQGLFLARTDYSKILLNAKEQIGKDIPRAAFLNALLDTMNAARPRGTPAITADHQVFPATYRVAGVTLNRVTIRQWVNNALPNTTGQQGNDLITKKHFPGSEAQKRELRPFGGFGSKTDPGNKLILEWRNLAFNHPDELPMLVEGLVNYIRQVNQERQSAYATAALFAGAFALHALSPMILAET